MGSREPAVVEPVDVFEGGVLEVVEVLPGSAFVDEFCLVQADDGFGEGVIVRIAQPSRPMVRYRPPPSGSMYRMDRYWVDSNGRRNVSRVRSCNGSKEGS